jgi:hypothetical protein
MSHCRLDRPITKLRTVTDERSIVFRIRAISLAATLVVSGAMLAAAPLALAKGRDDVRVRGTCSQSSSSKLKLKLEDSGIEVEFEVDQNRNGVPWKVTLKKNGVLAASGKRVTRAPSGSFEFRRVLSGAHATIAATATRNGERCTARATI